MGTMEYIGLGFIVFAVCLVLFFLKKRIEYKRVLACAFICIFVGCIFIFYERIEILEIAGVGKIKTWVQEAKTGADVINQIKKEVQGTKTKINSVIEDINEATDKLNKLDEFSKTAEDQIGNLNKFSKQASTALTSIQDTQKKANQELKQIESTSEFMMLIVRATNDDRLAVDEIHKISQERNHPFFRIARNAIQEILIETNPMITLRIHPKYPWRRDGLDPNQLTFDEFIAIYNRVIPYYKPGIIVEIWSADRFSKYQKIKFLIEVIESDNSVRAAEYAARLVNKEARTGKNFLAKGNFITWFEENEERLKNE